MVYAAEDDHGPLPADCHRPHQPPDMGANFLNEAGYALMREGDVLFTDSRASIRTRDSIYGVTLVVDRTDGSRVRSSLYYHKGRLYIADAVVCPRAATRTCPPPHATTRHPFSRRMALRLNRPSAGSLQGAQNSPLPSPQPRFEQPSARRRAC